MMDKIGVKRKKTCVLSSYSHISAKVILCLCDTHDAT